MTSLRYGVIGTGGLGGYYGGQLAHSGKDVHFLFNSDYAYVRMNGLRVDSINGDFHLDQVSAYQTTTDMPECDVLLVCLKTTHNHLLPAMLPPVVHSGTVVIMIQNGLGVEEELAAWMPHLNIAGGLAFIGSSKTGPGHITHVDLGSLIIGGYNLKSTEILQQVSADFLESGVPCRVSDNLYAARWQKLVWNVPFNGMSVVLNTTTDQLVSDPSTRQLALEMMLEVIHAANHCRVSMKEELATRMMEMTDGMNPYAPSMKLDYDFKRPMEIDAIYTRPVQEAAKAGFEMKAVAVLEKQLRFIERRSRE
ncbi:MAG: putative 2-dehydropantoate 2-reductase [Mangrovibacterium sp.]